jgi:hypothetical protein
LSRRRTRWRRLVERTTRSVEYAGWWDEARRLAWDRHRWWVLTSQWSNHESQLDNILF